VAPIPLNDRQRWAVLPLSAETVLCGNDLLLPPLDQLRRLYADLDEMEGVFYGWPTVVVEDDRGRPFVAPLFVRELDRPRNGAASVSVGESLPQVNMGLLTASWFSPELIASAAAVLAQGLVGFGLASAVVSVAKRLVAALGLPAGPLDPGRLVDPATLGDPWLPQEVGIFNLVMAFRGRLDDATRELVKDLKWMVGATDWRDSAARFLFEVAAPPVPSLPASRAMQLNASQEAALASAAAAPLTVITGPPGTGKSQVVAAIVADAWLRGETVLVTSTNNAPIDGVINDKMLNVDEALILRTGNTEKRRELGARLRELVARVPRRPAEVTVAPLAETAITRHQAARILEQRARLEHEVLSTTQDRDRAREAVWGSHPPPPVDRAGLRALAERAARTRWRWLKRRRIAACLSRAGIEDPSVTAERVRDWIVAEDSFGAARREETAFRLAHPDMARGFREAENEWLLASRTGTRARVRDGFAAGKEALVQLADVLTDELPRRDAIERAMVHVKGWATSALSTRPNFTCRAGVIDLVVIDEASQCTLAQVLPLAYRARRLVVVGDPQQLPPVITAGAMELRTLAATSGTTHEELVTAKLAYGEDSAYTAFAARHGRKPFLLDEHYRCHPAIIQFCNEQFYDNDLTILTSVSPNRDQPRGMEWCEVAGRTERGRSGGAFNRIEAEAVVEWLADDRLPTHSLGVVTPFREQAKLIRQLLSGARRDALKEVRVGTAHTFQGGERDTILFSTVLPMGANPGTVTWLEGERNLMNVAVSRARNRLVVFGNRRELGRLGATTLIALADSVEGRHQQQNIAFPEATVRLHRALVAYGIPARLGDADEGYPLAITLSGSGGRRINVEVSEFPDGDPSGRVQRQMAIRDDNVRTLGWTVMRIPAWRAYLDPSGVADEVLKAARPAEA
jgi:AAA domain